jgi:4-hydroxy-3-polyprenylbenzoate decarboxylase
MSFSSLRDFISFLEKNQQLTRIKEPVDTALEITEIQKRLIEKKGPAILFENIIHKGEKNNIKVLANLFGSVERIAHGLNCKSTELEKIGTYLATLRQPMPPSSIKEGIEMLPLAKKMLKMKPKTVKKAPCQEITWLGEQIDLDKLPIQTCWPNEPAPLITWPLIVTKGPNKDAKEDDYNLGIYRMQQFSKNKLIMRWLKHRGGAQQYQRFKETKQQSKFPAAAVIGSDPATILAAVAPVPDNLSEYKFAALLRDKATELVKCKTIPLKVPANAEIILEGYVSLDEYLDEGPYGDHTGYYNSVEKFPAFELTAITMRKNPIYLTTYTGKPPDEPSVLGEAFNEIFNPILKQQFPEITDFWLPPEGCSYRIAVIAIKKSYPGHAKRIMFGIWSYLRQFLYCKFIIILDAHINIRNWQEVMWAISTKMDFARDVTIIENTPIDYLDFASIESGLGAKIGFDATDKIGNETKREWGQEIAMSENVKKKIDILFKKTNL